MSRAARVAILILSYTILVVAWLAWRPENELAHWVTLVVLPACLLRFAFPGGGWRALGRAAGLASRPSARGIAAALLVGGALSLLQLAGRNAEPILEILRSGRALLLAPASFALMLVTAATTEEFLFRGLLQSRVRAAWGSDALAIGVASAGFALYHWPYAYHRPGWGTEHELWGSLRAAAETGLPLGVLLGLVYRVAGGNLRASILAHALINTLPGMLAVERLLGSR